MGRAVSQGAAVVRLSRELEQLEEFGYLFYLGPSVSNHVPTAESQDSPAFSRNQELKVHRLDEGESGCRVQAIPRDQHLGACVLTPWLS